MSNIFDIAKKLNINEKYIIPFGYDKAKISLKIMDELKDRPNGKLVLVTAITPTKAGEGKTTTSIGLHDGLNYIGVPSLVCLREPSLGPVFGIKGGATGHHGDVPAKYIIANLVQAADTLSAARPGARSEILENYIKRIEQLEEICKSYDGVYQSYAMQSGRELRVMVIPEKIDDVGAFKLARDIKERIENEMTRL